MNGLRLDVSIGREKYDAMEETYRNEGLSVGVDHMVRCRYCSCGAFRWTVSKEESFNLFLFCSFLQRLYGEDIQVMADSKTSGKEKF